MCPEFSKGAGSIWLAAFLFLLGIRTSLLCATKMARHWQTNFVQPSGVSRHKPCIAANSGQPPPPLSQLQTPFGIPPAPPTTATVNRHAPPAAEANLYTVTPKGHWEKVLRPFRNYPLLYIAEQKRPPPPITSPGWTTSNHAKSHGNQRQRRRRASGRPNSGRLAADEPKSAPFWVKLAVEGHSSSL